MTGFIIQRWKLEQRDAYTGEVMWRHREKTAGCLQAKERPGPDLPAQHLEGTKPSLHVISDLHSRMWDNKLLFFKWPGSRYFIMAIPANKYTCSKMTLFSISKLPVTNRSIKQNRINKPISQQRCHKLSLPPCFLRTSFKSSHWGEGTKQWGHTRLPSALLG